MTDIEINIAIAEACGWKFYCVNAFGEQVYHGPQGEVASAVTLPDYVNDLNAMREAEATLQGDNRSCYHDYLYVVIADEMDRTNQMPFADAFERGYAMMRATARQRGESFLRTLGKWKD